MSQTLFCRLADSFRRVLIHDSKFPQVCLTFIFLFASVSVFIRNRRRRHRRRRTTFATKIFSVATEVWKKIVIQEKIKSLLSLLLAFPAKMDNRRTISECSSIMSASTDVSLYNNNNNNNHIINNNDDDDDIVDHGSNRGKSSLDLKLERSGSSPINGSDGSRTYFLRWKGFEGNLIR